MSQAGPPYLIYKNPPESSGGGRGPTSPTHSGIRQLRVNVSAGDAGPLKVGSRVMQFKTAFRNIPTLHTVKSDLRQVLLILDVINIAVTNVRHVKNDRIVGRSSVDRGPITGRAPNHLIEQWVGLEYDFSEWSHEARDLDPVFFRSGGDLVVGVLANCRTECQKHLIGSKHQLLA